MRKIKFATIAFDDFDLTIARHYNGAISPLSTSFRYTSISHSGSSKSFYNKKTCFEDSYVQYYPNSFELIDGHGYSHVIPLTQEIKDVLKTL